MSIRSLDRVIAEFKDITVISGDFGLSYRSSAGKVSGSTINVNCSRVDINGMISVGANEYAANVLTDTITTPEGTITAYAGR